MLAEHIQDDVDHVPPELVMGPVKARLREHFAPLAARTRKAVIEALDSERYFTLLNELDQILASPPLGPDATLPAKKGLARPVARTYRQTDRRMRRAGQADAGEAANIALHSARRAAKRARYAAEVVSPAYGHPGRRFAKQMKKVQTSLGAHQDAVIARNTIREIGVRAHLEGRECLHLRAAVRAQHLCRAGRGAPGLEGLEACVPPQVPEVAALGAGHAAALRPRRGGGPGRRTGSAEDRVSRCLSPKFPPGS